MIAAGTCVVRWQRVPASVSDADLDELHLTPAEKQRMRRFRHQADRARFALATNLLRGTVGNALDVDPGMVDIDRACDRCGAPDHGRPTLPGLDLFASITHAGATVGVAVTAEGPVGIDVEPVPADACHSEADSQLLAEVLGAGERARTRWELLRCWTRKEAVVKATGDGIGHGLARVVLGPPGEPPRLVSYYDRGNLSVWIADLTEDPSQLAALAVLTSRSIMLDEAVITGPMR